MPRVIVHTYGDVLTRTGRRTEVRRFEKGASVADVALLAAHARWDDLESGEKAGPLTIDRLALVFNGEPITAASAACRRMTDGDVVMVGRGRPGDPTTLILLAISIAASAASALLATRVKLPSSENPTDTRRFGFDRSSHVAVSGDPIQVPLGAIARLGPKIVADVPVDGPDGDAKRRVLLSFGRGPIDAIGSLTTATDRADGSGVTGMFFDDQAVANSPGTLISTRMGQPNQRAIPGFRDTEVPHDVPGGGAILRNTSGVERAGGSSAASGEAVTYNTLDPVDMLRLLVRFARGLYTVAGSGGQIDNATAVLQYRLRRTDVGGGTPGSWGTWVRKATTRADQSPVVISIEVPDLTVSGSPEKYDLQVERVSIEPADASVADQMTFEQVVEVQESVNKFQSLAMLGLELTASEQRTSVPDCTANVRGLKNLRRWDGTSPPDAPVFTTGWSNNPADLALAAITDAQWGMGRQGQSDDNVDFASLFAWRTYCAEAVALAGGTGTRPRFAYNGVLQEQRNGVDSLRAICAAGRCTPIKVGRKWTFIYEHAQASPVEQFGEGDLAMADGKPVYSWKRSLTTGGKSVPNRVSVQFANEQREGRTDVVSWPPLPDPTGRIPNSACLWFNPDLVGGPEPVNEQTVKLEGVTNPEQALAEAKFRCKKLRYLSRSEKRTTTKQVVSVQPGDRYDAAALAVGYGLASGRLAGNGLNTTTTVRLDRSVVFESGKTYVIQVQHHDGTVEPREIASPSGEYPAGSIIEVGPEFSQRPGDYAGYSLGEVGKAVKPYICTAVRPNVENGGSGAGGSVKWEIEGVEYLPSIYDDTVDLVDLPDYSSLVNSRTPPGPVLDITVREQINGSTRTVTVSWRQSPVDAVNTAYFRVYRRDAGTTTPILVPTLSPSKRAAVVELTDLGRAYQFAAIAVSSGGAALSPYDPRVKWGGVIFGLFQPPPAAPTGATLTQVAGNVYDLTWTPPVDDGAGNPVVGYQVLFGAGTTSTRPNDGAEDCLVLARTALPELRGLILAPGDPHRFYVRSVNAGGRLSKASTLVIENSPDYGVGLSVKHSYAAGLDGSTGTLVNCSWDSGTSRLLMTDPDTEASFTGDVQDTGSATLCQVTVDIGTANDHLTGSDLTLQDRPLKIPSIAADQWAVGGLGDSSKKIAMVNPPFPDDEVYWTIELRSSVDGVDYTDWVPIVIGQAYTRMLEFYQVRVRFGRKTAGGPYRPAVWMLDVEAYD